MMFSGVKVGVKVAEGKSKVVYIIPETHHVLLHSKDRITARDGERAHEMKGKAEMSTTTTCVIFELLNNAGIKTHFIKRQGKTTMVTHRCDMIPIEWVTRRLATGSFLKRNPGVTEGYRFYPPKLETFLKDDKNHDPQWSYEQCIEAKLTAGPRIIGQYEIDIISRTTVTVFEILEKAWASLGCSLIDMKVEFGINHETGEILLADVIDNDSWRLWPAGDRRLMKDVQVYRELKEVTAKDLDMVKRNFEWVADKVSQLSPSSHVRAVVFMGSPVYMAHCEKIRSTCETFGVPCELRVSSADKGCHELLNILAQYEGEGIPTVFIAVAGSSNGLGPVLSGNAIWPVINCPPADWVAEDIWSSLRVPTDLGCTTVTSPDAAALAAVQILGLGDHIIWSKLRANQLNTWINLKEADKKTRN
ncbi:multifunctional protein ADE2-like [Ruditapes philippinarum]|uniref:multifunctional protein ADE2-like n=1 Tax=Ruditapes philippinarum TaxID=129788 RepID=UPI00295B21D9|nr:multifunctional protein ADE2-like [Ruditapes philippinarum]